MFEPLTWTALKEKNLARLEDAMVSWDKNAQHYHKFAMQREGQIRCFSLRQKILFAHLMVEISDTFSDFGWQLEIGKQKPGDPYFVRLASSVVSTSDIINIYLTPNQDHGITVFVCSTANTASRTLVTDVHDPGQSYCFSYRYPQERMAAKVRGLIIRKYNRLKIIHEDKKGFEQRFKKRLQELNGHG